MVQGEIPLARCARAGAVVKYETVAIGGKHEGDVQRFGVVERLLHAVADAVRIVLGLDDGKGNVGLVVQDVVGALALPACDQLSANDDAALGETHLLADLVHLVPACATEGGGDELGADVAFGEGSFVHGG